MDADLAVVNDETTLQALALHRREIKLEELDLFLGLSGRTLRWTWLDGEEVSTADELWGPNEPTGDGRCGSFSNAIQWDSNWAGYGWRWNDFPCTEINGYICEQPLGMSYVFYFQDTMLLQFVLSFTFDTFFNCMVLS